MKIRIKLYGVLRIGRFKDEVREFPDGTSIAEIVDGFQFPAFQLGIILVNEVHAELETGLKEGDLLSLLPVVDGG